MNKKAFTLIELLVVISIIALLLSILLPALGHALQQARSVVCLNNLRQITQTTHIYAIENNDFYPIAYLKKNTADKSITLSWDFSITKDWNTGETIISSGLIWQGDLIPEEIQQCPDFKGNSNTLSDPFTGYNYNTSYIGHGAFETRKTPAKVSQVKRPTNCALFGDGQYANGANKYMRSPWIEIGVDEFSFRHTGTQGYRHSDSTNVAWCDGSASVFQKRFTNTQSPDEVAPGTGFLSSNNNAYDLK